MIAPHVIVIPRNATTLELCKLRRAMEACEPMPNDPVLWRKLAAEFRARAAVLNAQRCEDIAAQFAAQMEGQQ